MALVHLHAIPLPTNSKALVFAWAVESIAVVMGLTLAIFAGVEGSDGGIAAMVIAILPFMALSVIELTKIPLVGLAFRVSSLPWRVLATVALLVVTAATFENFVFGFERGFNERLRAVENAEHIVKSHVDVLELAKTHIPMLVARQDELSGRLSALREEVAGIRTQATQDIADSREGVNDADSRAERLQLQQELAGLDRRRDAEIARERQRCGVPGVACSISGIVGSYRRQSDLLNKQLAVLLERQQKHQDQAGSTIETARTKRDAGIAGKERERTEVTAELEKVRTDLSAAQNIVLAGSEQVSHNEQARDELIEKSQLHRLSRILFGNYEQVDLEKTKRLFVVSLAAIVAVIGSVIAALHYAAQSAARNPRRPLQLALRGYLARRRQRLPVRIDLRENVRQSFKASRAIRGYYLRKRKPLVIIRKEIKEVVVDRLKLVYIPLDATEDEIDGVRTNAAKAAA